MSTTVVVITGCSKGIGQGLALHLAKDPQRRFKVYATMRDCETKQEDTKTKAGSCLEDTLFIRELDVTKQDIIDKTIKDIIKNDGGIDVLVNNAGILQPTWWETTPMDKAQEIMNTNFFGCVRTTQAVTPIMKAKRSGKILQISSLLGFKAMPMTEDYNASKFALEGFSESIAPLLRKFNIWISIIEPGLVSTHMLQQLGNDYVDLYKAIVNSYESAGVAEEDVKIVKDMLLNKPECGFGTELQTIDDIAKMIQEVILSPNPDFRCQTSQTVKDRARQRFVDPTGNSIIESWL